MDFEEWEPLYTQILREFRFSRAEDERAAQILDRVLGGHRVVPDDIRPVIAGQSVAIAGNAPRLKADIQRLTDVVVAADEATSTLLEHGLVPHVVVTDLDGRVEDQIEANRRGAFAVVHAHGDNIPAIERWAGRFPGKTLATTQSRPFGRVHNFGGFTDGDRSVFLADALGARSIRLVGFDFEHPNPKDRPLEVKKKKLDWAYILIQTVLSEREAFARGVDDPA